MGRPRAKAPRAAPKKRGAAAAKKASAEPRPFERVWALVRRIPRGKVATYGQLSALIDRRLSAIAVGWAVRAAPEGTIPWHRVVNARGGVSTDADHPGLQRSLLEAEGVRFGKDGCIDLARFAHRPRAAAGRARASRGAP